MGGRVRGQDFKGGSRRRQVAAPPEGRGGLGQAAAAAFISLILSFQPIRENTGDKCPLQWTSSPRSPLPTMGRHVAGTRTGLSPPATSSSSFSFQLYNCIAKCQCTDCTRNVLWCQVHSSHIHSNHKTLNYNCIAIKLQLYCQVSLH